tara:strand:- start:4291 stop:4737 length:447 start_codon:yes stop_codon:yes gene_type:complete
MQSLNLPDQNLKVEEIDSKKYIFDFTRKKNLILTPEEWVRQNIVSHLVNDLNYPKGLIKTESSIKYNNLKKRSDIIVRDRSMGFYLLVECKSYNLKINKNFFKQVSIYNKVYKSRYIMISNGIDHYVCEFFSKKKEYKFLKSIPVFID